MPRLRCDIDSMEQEDFRCVNDDSSNKTKTVNKSTVTLDGIGSLSFVPLSFTWFHSTSHKK
jgi:hypothetical protein